MAGDLLQSFCSTDQERKHLSGDLLKQVCQRNGALDNNRSLISLVLTALAVTAAVAFFGTVALFIQDPAAHNCFMTYMFVPPRYVFPGYGLYLYEEGWPRDEATEFEKVSFAGVPILFVPGTGGSHRQARSIGSILLVKAYERKWPIYFDIFAVDFNEEFTGIYGPSIEDQTHFLASAIDRIFEVYIERGNNSRNPNTLLIYAHSLGGIVVKNLYTLAGFDASRIRAVILLSVPVTEPAVRLDRQVMQIYERIERLWSDDADDALKNLTIVSVNGGHLDLLVRQDATVCRACRNSRRYFLNVATTSVSRVWSSADHLSIVWCRELNLAISRFIKESVDNFTSYQITTDARTIYLAALRQFSVPPFDVYVNLSSEEPLSSTNLNSLPASGESYNENAGQILSSNDESVRITEVELSSAAEIEYAASSKHAILADLMPASAGLSRATTYKFARIFMEAAPAHNVKNLSIHICLRTRSPSSHDNIELFGRPINCRRISPQINKNENHAFLTLPNVRGGSALLALLHVDIHSLARFADKENNNLTKGGEISPSLKVAFQCGESSSCHVRLQIDEIANKSNGNNLSSNLAGAVADFVLPNFYKIIQLQATNGNVLKLNAKSKPIIRVDISTMHEPWQSVRWRIQLHPAKCYAAHRQKNSFSSTNALPSVRFRVRHDVEARCMHANGSSVGATKIIVGTTDTDREYNNFDDVRLAPFLCSHRRRSQWWNILMPRLSVEDGNDAVYDLIATGYTVPSPDIILNNEAVDGTAACPSEYILVQKPLRILEIMADGPAKWLPQCAGSHLHISYGISWWFLTGEIFRYAGLAMPAFIAAVCLYRSVLIQLNAIHIFYYAEFCVCSRVLSKPWPGAVVAFAFYYAGEHAMQKLSAVEVLHGIHDDVAYFIVGLLWFSTAWLVVSLLLVAHELFVALGKKIMRRIKLNWSLRSIKKYILLVVVLCAVISIIFCSSVSIIINAVAGLVLSVGFTASSPLSDVGKNSHYSSLWSSFLLSSSLKQVVSMFYAVPALVFYMNSSRTILSPDPLLFMACPAFLQQAGMLWFYYYSVQNKLLIQAQTVTSGTAVKSNGRKHIKSLVGTRNTVKPGRPYVKQNLLMLLCWFDVVLAVFCLWYAKQSIYRIFDAFMLSFINDIIILLLLSPDFN